MIQRVVPFLLLAAGCPSKEDTGFITTGEVNDADADADADSDADSDADTDSDPEYFEPIAVGFELVGGWDAMNGTLVEYTYDEVDTYVPYVVIKFADADFFGASSDEEQAAHDCNVYAYFTQVPADIPLYSYESGDPVGTSGSWEGRLDFDKGSFEADDKEENCTNFDPATFPGGDPVETFSGMHFGVSFGDLTEYLESAWSKTTIEDYSDFMFTQGIAVNHPTGDGGYSFEAFDWTTGFLFEMDLATGLVSSDEKGYLIFTDTFDTGGFVNGNAYWYEDFPNLDFSLLKEGAPEL